MPSSCTCNVTFPPASATVGGQNAAPGGGESERSSSVMLLAIAVNASELNDAAPKLSKDNCAVQLATPPLVALSVAALEPSTDIAPVVLTAAACTKSLSPAANAELDIGSSEDTFTSRVNDGGPVSTTATPAAMVPSALCTDSHAASLVDASASKAAVLALFITALTASATVSVGEVKISNELVVALAVGAKDA